MNFVLLCRDLMLSSRVEGAARNLGFSVRCVSDATSAIAAIDHSEGQLVFVDLQLPNLDLDALVEEVRNIRGTAVRIVACGPHVHEQRLNAARQAGCDQVVTRGQFERDSSTILQA